MTQITKKFIAPNAVDGSKILLLNNELLRGRNAANTADVPILRVDALDRVVLPTQFVNDVALPIPTAAKALATIEYVQNYVIGKTDVKDAVDLLVATNIPLTGSNLVADGVTVTNGMRLALDSQTAPVENGVYVATVTGVNYTLARAPDFDQVADESGREVTKGAHFKIISGAVFTGWELILTTPDPITVGTSPLTFVRYPSAETIVGGDMIAKVGSTLSVDIQPLGGLESSNPGNVAGQIRVLVDPAALEKDKTTRLDPITGAVAVKRDKQVTFTLAPADVTNQYVDLPDVAADQSVKFSVAGGGAQITGVDFTINYTGGAASKTRVSFAGGLATAGVSALAAGDVVLVEYRAF